jgi:hypothetical protein
MTKYNFSFFIYFNYLKMIISFCYYLIYFLLLNMNLYFNLNIPIRDFLIYNIE